MKTALWTLGHLGGSNKGSELLNTKGILTCMVRLAQHCVVYSIRATSFFALSLIATTKIGADCLFKLGKSAGFASSNDNVIFLKL